jgi:hypothetical protein
MINDCKNTRFATKTVTDAKETLEYILAHFFHKKERKWWE